MKKFERGSLWRKWDLHVHTIKSVFNNNFRKESDEEKNVEKYIYELYTRAIENDVSSIGLTDYFTIEGYEIVQKFITDKTKMKKLFENELKNDSLYLEKIYDIQLFPNIEFRLGEVIVNKESKQSKIEVHVLFDNNLSVNEINENFLSKIEFSTSTNVEGSNNFSLNRRNLEKLGRDVKKHQVEFKSMDDFEAGCNVAYVKLDQIKEILEKNFKGKYILLFAEDDITDINWGDQGYQVRKNIYSSCHGMFSSNKKTIEWGLKEETKEEFSSYKPCFWGSDAHDYKKMFKPDNDRFCWIKSDLTFNGLKQVLINPYDRIYIGNIAPEYDNYKKNKQNIISEIDIRKNSGAKNTDEWFNQSIKINPYMTTIIGNKGSGKSALSDIIALVCNNKNIEYASFLNDDRFRKKPENYANDYNSEITWADGNKNSVKSLSDTVEEASVELVQFLPQRYIENVCTGIKHEFNDEIEKTIFSYMDIAEKEGCTSLQQLISKKSNANYEEYQLLKNELEKINIRIIELEAKKTTINKKIINEKINSLNLILARHEESKPSEVKKPKTQDDSHSEAISYIDDECVKVQTDYNNKIDSLKIINDNITSIKNFLSKKDIELERINELNNDFKELANKLDIKNTDFITYKINDNELNSVFNKLVNEKIKLDKLVSKTEFELGKLSVPENFDFQKSSIKELIDGHESLYSKMKIYGLIKERIVNDASLTTQKYQRYLKDLETWNTKKKQILGEIDGYPDGSLKHYNEEKEYLEKRLDDDLNNLYNDRKELLGKIYDYYTKKCNILDDIYKPIEERLKKVLELMEEKIKFDVQIVSNSNLNIEIINKVDQRINGFFYGKQAGIANVNNLIAETKFDNKENTIYFIEEIYKNINCNIDDVERLLNGKILEFYNYIGSMEYLNSQYTLRLGNKDLKQLSPGERGIVLLIFYLSLSKSNIPLIIDQPEDNLDNQSVYGKLVPCIKNAKKMRQIIIVTHNPNIAIACDSEQIIYCEINKDTNKIEYSSGSIENNKMNEKVVDILEGTMPAFDLRRKKYY